MSPHKPCYHPSPCTETMMVISRRHPEGTQVHTHTKNTELWFIEPCGSSQKEQNKTGEWMSCAAAYTTDNSSSIKTTTKSTHLFCLRGLRTPLLHDCARFGVYLCMLVFNRVCAQTSAHTHRRIRARQPATTTNKRERNDNHQRRITVFFLTEKTKSKRTARLLIWSSPSLKSM